MKTLYPTDNKELTLKIKVRTDKPEKIVLKVKDAKKPYTCYTDRYSTINGESTFFVRMPQSPQMALIELYNEANGNLKTGQDKSFKIVDRQVLPLNKKLNSFDSSNDNLNSFIKFAQQFSERAGILSAGHSIYKSDDGQFRIDYLDRITNQQGQVLKTPARISQSRGVIEISRAHFLKYTVPMRFAILMHEFSHFYLNKNMSDEIEADLNALLVYLCLGYPRIEAHQTFLTVFKGSPSDLNKRRYQVLKEFIDNFEKYDLKFKQT